MENQKKLYVAEQEAIERSRREQKAAVEIAKEREMQQYEKMGDIGARDPRTSSLQFMYAQYVIIQFEYYIIYNMRFPHVHKMWVKRMEWLLLFAASARRSRGAAVWTRVPPGLCVLHTSTKRSDHMLSASYMTVLAQVRGGGSGGGRVVSAAGERSQRSHSDSLGRGEQNAAGYSAVGGQRGKHVVLLSVS